MKTAALPDRPEAVRARSLGQVLEDLDVAPFSPPAIVAYKQKHMRAVWRRVSLLAWFFGKHPRYWRKIRSLPWIFGKAGFCLCMAGLATFAFITLLPIYIPSLYAVLPFSLYGGVAGFVMFFLCSVIEYRFFEPFDMPKTGKSLFGRILKDCPDAHFSVHRLKKDLLLEVSLKRASAYESYIIYGWNRSNGLVEVDGKLVETPTFKL